MMTEHRDYIIIGGGVIGLCTAYHLSKAGAKPLIIEQFSLPHTRGSSHGESRLVREAHYDALTSQAYKQWQAIEKEGGKQLLIVSGLLLFQDNYGKDLQSSREAMERLNLPHEWIEGKELQRRYSDTYSGILDKRASIILASKAVNVLQRLVEKEGVQIRDGEKVVSVKPGPVVIIETSKGTYTANKLILATGPWSKELTDSLGLQLPLTTMPGQHMYWETEQISQFHPDTFPMMDDKVNNLKEGYRFFLIFPVVDHSTKLKIVTRGEPAPFYCHPDERDKHSMQPMVDVVSDYIKQHFPSVNTKPSIIEPCMYCMTPDRNGIIDRHPNFPNILIGTAFSGKGFMLAPIVGQVLSELAMDCQPTVDTTAFAIARFGQQSKL